MEGGKDWLKRHANGKCLKGHRDIEGKKKVDVHAITYPTRPPTISYTLLILLRVTS